MIRLAVVLGTAGAVLTACAGVPTSGPIQQGPVVAAAAGDQVIRVIARPPEAGMTPEELVRGFQEATAGADAGYTTAREYLTDDASAAWRPDSGVQVYDDSGLVTTLKDDVVTQQGVLSATIAADGEYSVVAPPPRTTWQYKVVKVDGEWRISSLPQGLLLGPGDVQRSYRSFDLYYFTRDFEALVPAPVTIPVSASGQATQLVRGLLAGPTSWIAPAVRSAFPEGTRLQVDSVPVIDGVAEVALTREVLNADDVTRQKLSGQLVWTLRQVPGITGVRIAVNGQALAVPGVATTQPIDSWSILDPDALPDSARAWARTDKGISRLTNDLAPEPALVLKPQVDSPAISLDSTQVAGVSSDRSTLYVGRLQNGSSLSRSYAGTDLSRPSWDRTGAVWVADRGRGLVVVRGGSAAPLAVGGAPDGFSDAGIIAVSVSRDGTRAGLLVRRGSLVEPWVARIERNGASLAVSAPRRVESQVSEALDLAWVDADTLAVLGASRATSLEVLDIGVGSSRVRHQVAPDSTVTTLGAGPARPDLLGDRTSTWRAVGASWERIEGLSQAVYPG